MRRKLAAAVLAAGMLAAAGCTDGGGASTEDVCEDLNQTVEPLNTQLTSAVQAAGTAAALEDEEALAEAGLELNDVVGQITGAIRDGADDAADDEFSDALNALADELDELAESMIAGEQPDLVGLGDAADGVETYCGDAPIG